MRLVDWLYPKKCVGCEKKGRYFCWECLRKIKLKSGRICPECNKPGVGGRVHLGCKNKYSLDGIVGLLSYKGLVRLGVHNLKYQFLQDLEAELSAIFSKALKIRLKSREGLSFKNFLRKRPLIVPVPLYWRRENWRGFNQAETVGKMLKELSGLDFLQLLERKRMTKPQTKLSKKARGDNVKKAFRIRIEMQVAERVLLVDDVWTTGETMKACCKVLKEGGVKEVWGLTLAR